MSPAAAECPDVNGVATRCGLHHLKDIDPTSFSYMCFKKLASDHMLDFTGFHHIHSTYAFVHVSNKLYFTMPLVSVAQPE